MPGAKRTRKGRPPRDAQRSALIVARGKKTGRDAQVAPKRGVVPPPAPNLASQLDAPDSVEAFLERATIKAWPEVRLAQQEATVDDDSALFESLAVPRRPAWDASMSASQVHESEEASFVAWRRRIAEREEAERSQREARLTNDFVRPSATVSTPFERNLEVWRQLWRTVERSDCVFVIVDARWPSFYAPNDLLDYVTSQGKSVVIVINKADFLTTRQRRAWLDELETHAVFFSAKQEQYRLDGKAYAYDEDHDPETRLFKSSELLELGAARAADRRPRGDRPFCVGLVGYPNVGKSSCVNALRGAFAHGVGARAAVSATPGKTKHLQTLRVNDDLELCDCPGLVFPALVKHGTAELVCSGVVPLARARDPVTAAQTLVASRVPAPVFDLLYGTDLAANPENVLDAVCRARDYKTAGSSNFDKRRAAVQLVKDYVDGTLLYCHPPPGADLDAFNVDTRTTSLKASALLKAKLDAALDKSRNHHRQAVIVAAAKQAGFQLPDDGSQANSGDAHDDLSSAQPDTAASSTSSKKKGSWGKKNRKNRDPDPYRTRDDLDDLPPIE